MNLSRWTARRILAALGLGLFTLAAAATDDPPGRVGRVGDTLGRVWMMEAGQGEWFDLQRNRPVTTGDRISTDRDGRVELQIGSTTLRIAERSELQVLRLDDARIELLLNQGSASLRVRQPEVAAELALETSEGRFSPRGPGLFRIDREGRGTLAAAQQGELMFDSRDSSLPLRAGQRAEFWLDPADRLTHYTWAAPANDAFDQWVRREDDEDQRRAAAQRWVSPEMTGAEDLDRYGRWASHPDYGPLWTPVGVAVDWAPYRYGHWAWVRPWGWTWVDDAPWGFAPFHYGRWVHWGGRWCWAPGRYEPRPVYAPAMVAWVGGSHLSLSVQVGGGPAVGWIPLAPREPYYPVYRASPGYLQQINGGRGVVLPPQPQPHAPVMYGNRGVPGGVTVVPAQALAQRQPVAGLRAPDEAAQRVLGSGQAQFVAPPPPSGATQAPRVVSTPANVLAGPQGRELRAPVTSPSPDNSREEPVRRPYPVQRGDDGGRAVSAEPAWRAPAPRPVQPVEAPRSLPQAVEPQRPAVQAFPQQVQRGPQGEPVRSVPPQVMQPQAVQRPQAEPAQAEPRRRGDSPRDNPRDNRRND